MHAKYPLLSLMLVSALLSILLPACQKNNFDNAELVEHNSEFAFPLFRTNLNAGDLLFQVLDENSDDDTLRINADNTMTLIYQGDVSEKKATDIFKDLAGGPGTPPIPLSEPITLAPLDAPDGVTVRKATLKSGTLRIGVTNGTNELITGKVIFPQLKKNGKAFEIPFTALTFFPFVSQPVSVQGYTMELDSNYLLIQYIAIRPNGDTIKLPSTNNIPPIFVEFKDIQFNYLEGYWANQFYDLLRDTIPIDINQTDLNSNVRIRNPKVTFTVSNSWGFPTRGIIRYLSFIGQDGQEYPLKSSAFLGDTALDFNYPKLNEVGQTKDVVITLDEDNSNIAEIFNSQPTQLIYDLDGLANALDLPNLIGFITDSSVIRLRVRVELLLEGSAKNFEADQTLNLQFGDYEDLDTSNIESVEFKLATDNSIPITADMQLYFIDSAGLIVDSLFTGGSKAVLRAAPVDSEGKSNGTTRTEEFIPMDVARFNRVRKSEKGRLVTSFTTTNGGNTNVRLLATDQADVKMGIKVRTRW